MTTVRALSLALLLVGCSAQVTVDPPCVERADDLAARVAVVRAWSLLFDEDITDVVLRAPRTECRKLPEFVTGRLEPHAIIVGCDETYNRRLRVVSHEVLHFVLGETTGDLGFDHVGSWTDNIDLADGLASQLLNDWDL